MILAWASPVPLTVPHNLIINHSAGIDFRRQIMTSKVDPRTVRVKIFLMAVYP